MRYFNTEGLCRPNEHYMVQLNERLRRIKKLYVDRRKYFVINRGRQYGKTTTLRALEEYLKDEYLVVSMDFQRISTEEFADAQTFAAAFAKEFLAAFTGGRKGDLLKSLEKFAVEKQDRSLRELFVELSRICAAADRPVVLLIDEVDSASNNQVFIDFLAQLRGYYLRMEEKSIFHSVILAGVYDIKNLKLKIRPDDERQYNSSWNIAASFNIDMSFSVKQIKQMLEEYEADQNTGMDIAAVAKEIYQYTSGYPYLVSAVCKTMDERLPDKEKFEDIKKIWTREGIEEAVKLMLKTNTTLFDSMVKQLSAYKNLRRTIEEIIYQGKQIPFSPAEKSINMGVMFGFLKEQDGNVVIANRIFEMYLLNMFIAEEAVGSEIYFYGQSNKNQFIQNSRLNMEQVLKKFAEYFSDIYNDKDGDRCEECKGW